MIQVGISRQESSLSPTASEINSYRRRAFPSTSDNGQLMFFFYKPNELQLNINSVLPWLDYVFVRVDVVSRKRWLMGCRQSGITWSVLRMRESPGRPKSSPFGFLPAGVAGVRTRRHGYVGLGAGRHRWTVRRPGLSQIGGHAQSSG